MKKIYKVLAQWFLAGSGAVEGNLGVYDRVQHLKTLLLDELTPKIKAELRQSNTHKVLMVTHSRILATFSASGVVPEEIHPQGILTDYTYYQNVEAVPYTAD